MAVTLKFFSKVYNKTLGTICQIFFLENFFGPQITLITLIFYFFIICVNLCNLWTFFIGVPHEAADAVRLLSMKKLAWYLFIDNLLLSNTLLSFLKKALPISHLLKFPLQRCQYRIHNPPLAFREITC